jgi:ribose 5-phosphate isomerase B
MKKNLITEQHVIDTAKRGQKTMSVLSGSIITDAARDRAKQLGVELVSGKQDVSPAVPTLVPVSRSLDKCTVAIGSDHGGFGLKEILKRYLENLGYKVVDLGTTSEEACDYPDFAYAVARMVSRGDVSKGIMIDAIGNASAIVANKVAGIRAACCTDEFSARSSREHNDANILTLGGRILGSEIAKAVAKIWLETSFSGGRHQKRIDKINEIEAAQISSK